jgi:hypothetical protein
MSRWIKADDGSYVNLDHAVRMAANPDRVIEAGLAAQPKAKKAEAEPPSVAQVEA